MKTYRAKPMNVTTITLLILGWLLSADVKTTFAFDRAYLPLNAAIATADAIVAARTTRVPEGASLYSGTSAEVQVINVYKGSLASKRLRVHLNPLHAMALNPLVNGEQYLSS